ncbi:stress response protein [Haladaptatus paucihalophilus DX253]|uniref:Nucleotide-binding universal stress protein, UspA family n=1 Tax=Haladaptatus paucihalophilus DX253 TaxID=797209 RepID=E7QX86_HALPU|nr:universal stress protein [Haladaptatus paucihalophilus]EFW90889.1 stress response protein [Haladaptatus paucihalophilus DX253]SHK25102.1 Nucleotide-binding universal stress protein, UspA family [Haladaptatus paucihalophilus DX253]
MYDTILVPTDGSDSAAEAARNAVELAKRFDATIYAVYVIDIGAMWPDAYEGSILNDLEERGKKAVAAVREPAEDADIDVVDDVVTGGHPHRVILDYADDNDIDCIVMGTHGRRGLDRYLLGSVTERVVRMADVPVLTVHEPEE